MDMMSLRRRVMVNQNKLMTATGNPITFNTPLTKPLKECVVKFTPQQEGSGTPSPDNVRNISGWNAVKLWQSGKNLFDKSNVVGGYINEKGKVTGSSGSWAHQYIYVKGINKLTVSGSFSSTAARNVFFDAGMNPINTGTAATTKVNRTITVPSGAVWYGCSSFINPNRSDRDIDTLQVEIGETATEYEPYTGNEITFTFPSTVGDNGVVYGGYLDTEKGELVAEWYSFVIDGTNYCPTGARRTNDNGCAIAYNIIGEGGFSGLPYGEATSYSEVMADNVPLLNVSWQNIDRNCIQCGRTTDHLYLRVGILTSELEDVSSVSTIETSMRTWLQNHPIRVCYLLATPIRYSLAPQLIATLRGENVMWSDANGDITVRYWTR